MRLLARLQGYSRHLPPLTTTPGHILSLPPHPSLTTSPRRQEPPAVNTMAQTRTLRVRIRRQGLMARSTRRSRACTTGRAHQEAIMMIAGEVEGAG